MFAPAVERMHGLVQSLGEAEAVRGIDFNSIINSSATFAQVNVDNQKTLHQILLVQLTYSFSTNITQFLY